jgi:hypothetical protein
MAISLIFILVYFKGKLASKVVKRLSKSFNSCFFIFVLDKAVIDTVVHILLDSYDTSLYLLANKTYCSIMFVLSIPASSVLITMGTPNALYSEIGWRFSLTFRMNSLPSWFRWLSCFLPCSAATRMICFKPYQPCPMRLAPAVSAQLNAVEQVQCKFACMEYFTSGNLVWQ